MKKNFCKILILSSACLPAALLAQPAVQVQEAATPPPAPEPPTVSIQERFLSPALTDVIRLTKANVEEPVILQFVHNSPVAYSLSAQDVLILREKGVTSTVIASLMQRGEEVRKQHATEVQSPAPPPPEPTPVQAAPQAPAQSAVVYANPNPSPTVIYSSPSYSYGSYYPYYGGYYGYGGCYPRYGYGYPGLSVGIGFGFGGCYGGGYHGGYHGGGLHATGGSHGHH